MRFLVLPTSSPRSVKLVSVLTTVVMLCSGCVAATSPDNWRPHDDNVYSSYNACFQQAQYGYSQAYVYANRYSAGGGSSSGVATNVASLKSCMQASGYQKRDATTAEVIVHVSTIPIWVPLCTAFLLVGVNCFHDL
jgi:hypothetical protein